MQGSSSFPGAAFGPRVTSRQRYLRQLAFSVLCWSGLIILEASQVFAADVPLGRQLPFVHYLAWAAFNWFVMVPLTPLIYQLGEHYPIVGPKWTTHLIKPHAFGFFVCLGAQALGRGCAGWIYTRHHELPATFIGLVSQWIAMRGIFAVIAYLTIILIAGRVQLREQARQREVHRAQVEASLASADLEKLRIQLQPHFLFNTLQAAITLVQQDPQAAEDVLLRLSQLLRVALDEMEAKEIPLSRELEILDLYVGIQRRRFGERLAVEVHADAAVLNYSVPPLILQPLVENAIRHGIGKRKGQDCVEIFARRHEDDLQIEVWNRNSIVEESQTPLDQRGVGLRNTRARLEYSYGSGASLTFRPLSPGGAVVLIVIPLHSGVPAATSVPSRAAV
ncbi:MAG TPA: histidine kinase [Acidobacteriaceae bacterium]|nr:histidine kinase [Acidobacteriaceae bacterium]